MRDMKVCFGTTVGKPAGPALVSRMKTDIIPCFGVGSRVNRAKVLHHHGRSHASRGKAHACPVAARIEQKGRTILWTCGPIADRRDVGNRFRPTGTAA